MIDRFNPATVHQPDGYSHVTISNAGRLVHLAGQCPVDLSGQVVGAPGDHVAQTEQVIANCLAVLEAAGAVPADVVRSVVYVVSDDSDVLSAVWRRLHASPLAAAFTGAATLLGVAALGYRGQLVEVDLTAALPDQPPPATVDPGVSTSNGDNGAVDLRAGRATDVDPRDVGTRDDFAQFVSAVTADFRSAGDTEWENGTLDRFLDGLSAFAGSRLADAPERDQEQASWRLFAEIVQAATGYE